MDKNKKLKLALYITIPVVIVAVILTIILTDLFANEVEPYVPDDGKPFYMIKDELSDIDRIEIYDGNSGTTAVINNDNGLDKVVNNLKSVKIQRGEMASKKFGYSYGTTIYYKNGDQMYYAIYSADEIDSQGYVYKIREGKLDYQLLTEYVNQANAGNNSDNGENSSADAS